MAFRSTVGLFVDERVCARLTSPNLGRLMLAWTKTPTKWYPLPLAVGAILLVVIQYRKKVARSENEVHVDDEGREVIKLKGPWHVHITDYLSYYVC